MNFISIGEVLWDVIGDAEHLGGAPLNFSAHAAKLGHVAYLVSAVGVDRRGSDALAKISALGLSTEYIRRVPDCATGYVTVTLDGNGQPCFILHRPAAYDFIELTPAQLEQLAVRNPSWMYFGTLAQMSGAVRSITKRIMEVVPHAKRFYDLNLRADSYNRELVFHLLSRATVTKLNEVEIGFVERLMEEDASESIEDFCRKWAARFGWEAVCVTRGDRGCALWLKGEYVESKAYPVMVADAIGAGDAFAAGLMHALSAGWEARRAADFANRLGALIASRAGAIPSWSLPELDSLGA